MSLKAVAAMLGEKVSDGNSCTSPTTSSTPGTTGGGVGDDDYDG
jgi:hypothetical protein